MTPAAAAQFSRDFIACMVPAQLDLPSIFQALRTVGRAGVTTPPPPAENDKLTTMREGLEHYVQDTRDIPALMALTGLDTFACGFDGALFRLLHRVLAAGFDEQQVTQMATWLWRQEWTGNLDIDLLPEMVASLSEAFMGSDAVQFPILLAGLHPEADRPWLDRVAAIAIAILTANAQAGLTDHALRLETLLVSNWLKREETEDHYDRGYGLWAPALHAAGKALAAAHPLAAVPPPSTRVGFFVHMASMLAHVEAMVTALQGLKQMSPAPLEPIVYCFGGQSDQLRQALNRLDVPLVELALEYPQRGWTSRLLALRERLAQDAVGTLVWLCLPAGLAFASGLGLAPRLVWWSMKFHPSAFPDLDGYITLHHGVEPTIHLCGRQWRTAPTCFLDLTTPSALHKAAAIKAQFDGRVVLGTLVREEKLASPPFLDCIIRILKANPQAIWLYPGRERQSMVDQAMAAAGVTDQVRFIGWVDTRVYAPVLDIFVDCWPLGAGLTAMQAMAAGVPYVTLHRVDHQGGYAGILDTLILSVLRDHPQSARAAQLRDIFPGDTLLAAPSEDDYCAIVQRLIDDAAFHAACGNAGRRYTSEILSNPLPLATAIVNHLTEIMTTPKALSA